MPLLSFCFICKSFSVFVKERLLSWYDIEQGNYYVTSINICEDCIASLIKDKEASEVG